MANYQILLEGAGVTHVSKIVSDGDVEVIPAAERFAEKCILETSYCLGAVWCVCAIDGNGAEVCKGQSRLDGRGGFTHMVLEPAA